MARGGICQSPGVGSVRDQGRVSHKSLRGSVKGQEGLLDTMGIGESQLEARGSIKGLSKGELRFKEE